MTVEELLEEIKELAGEWLCKDIKKKIEDFQTQHENTRWISIKDNEIKKLINSYSATCDCSDCKQINNKIRNQLKKEEG